MLLQNWLQHNRTLVWAMLTNKIHNLFRSTTLQTGAELSVLSISCPSRSACSWWALIGQKQTIRCDAAQARLQFLCMVSVHVIGQGPRKCNCITTETDAKWTFLKQTNSEFCPRTRPFYSACISFLSLLLLPQARLRSLGKKKQQPSVAIKSPTKQRKVESFSSLNHFSSFAPLRF